VWIAAVCCGALDVLTYVHEILHLTLLEALLERALLGGCESADLMFMSVHAFGDGLD
jgi:hypothetical protein